MARWIVVEEEAPDLVGLARRFLDAHVHKTLATLRRDGSPLFRLEVSALSVVRLGDPADHLVVETWREGKGLSRVERR